MATYENNALMSFKDKNGNLHILYPITIKENVEGFAELESTVKGYGRKLLPITGHIRDLKVRIDNENKETEVLKETLTNLNESLEYERGYKTCLVSEVDDTKITIRLCRGYWARNITISIAENSSKKYEVYMIQAWGIVHESLYSTGSSTAKTLINLCIDDAEYDSIDALKKDTLEFKVLNMTYKTTLSDGTECITTLIITADGVKIIESMVDGTKLVKSFVQPSSATRHTTIADHGTYMHWFTVNGSAKTSLWVESVEDYGNVVVKTLSFTGGF